MAPLIKPPEWSVLVVERSNNTGSQDVNDDVVASRNRILQAASLCGIPTFFAAHARYHSGGAAPAAHSSSAPSIHSLQTTGHLWAETSLGLALAATSRPSLLLCGYWLDECITFTALNALGEGYDVYVLTDASPPLDLDDRNTAVLRLVQAGVVPTTTRQAIREWAADISDASQTSQLLALL